MENLENEVTEQVTENTAEQTQKTYTQAEVDAMVREKLDQVLPGKIARQEARLRKEYDRKYGVLADRMQAGDPRESDGSGDIQPPEQPQYSQRDTEVLANAEAEEIIRGGFDEVVAQTERLAKVGAANMTPREKALFTALAKHRQAEERGAELEKLGVTRDVYESREFRDFAAKFSPSTPIGEVYDIYAKTQPKKDYPTMGSMTQGQTGIVKDYYTPEEIERLTDEDLDGPGVWEAVRRSMTGG